MPSRFLPRCRHSSDFSQLTFPRPRCLPPLSAAVPLPRQQSSSTATTGGASGPSRRDTTTMRPPPSTETFLIPTKQPHHSLRTFLAHARSTLLSPHSTTYAGTFYEYLALETLRRHGLSLQRVGGRGDSGIDLRGSWHLPCDALIRSAQPLSVLVQCKRLKGKAGPNLVRELEGACASYAASTGRSGGVLGLLVSTRAVTKGVREAMGRSRWGLGWVCLEVVRAGEVVVKEEEEEGGGEGGEGRGQGNRERRRNATRVKDADWDSWEDEARKEGRVRQILWNRAAGEAGLQGLDVTARYAGVEADPGHAGAAGKEVVLMWKGKPIPGA